MKIYSRTDVPPLIKVSVSSSDGRKTTEKFDVTDTNIGELFDLIGSIKKKISLSKKEPEKCSVVLREYDGKKLGKSKTVSIYGHDPLTVRIVLETSIQQYEKD